MLYPAPAYAATVWVAGETLWLAFPPSNGHTHGHSVHLSADVYGFQCALRILREREINGSLKINQKGAQSQHLADAMYKAIRASTKLKEVEASSAERKAAKDFLKDLGL